jgi:hypothetical protein
VNRAAIMLHMSYLCPHSIGDFDTYFDENPCTSCQGKPKLSMMQRGGLNELESIDIRLPVQYGDVLDKGHVMRRECE